MKTFTHLRWAILLVLFGLQQAPANAQRTYTPIYTNKTPLPIYQPAPSLVNWQLKMSTVRVAVPAGTRLNDLSRVQLTTTFSGGWNGDNWNLDRLTIIAVAGGQKKQVFTKLGRPLHRFTSDKKTFLAGM